MDKMTGEPGLQPGGRLGSPKASSTPSSPPSSGGVELPFQLNEPVGQSPPPHNYRHSRAYRHFKNPPQPHMCIRVTTVAGEELFINVLSWTRIVIPQEPSDPIPLYGGMRVPPGSPRCPPLVYAVMANPEVLKDSGRHSKDPEERRAMVELMCDFVEAMNPEIKLTRNAVILKDRDISGELKDVWNAVQAQRDREREEQISQQQQQQQQHYHNMSQTTQQIFQPKQPPQQASLSTHNTSVPDNKILYMEFGPGGATNFGKDVQIPHQIPIDKKSIDNTPPTAVAQSAIIDMNEYRNEPSGAEASLKIETEQNSDMTDSKSDNKSDQQSAGGLGNNLAQVNNMQINSSHNQSTTVSAQQKVSVTTNLVTNTVAIVATTTASTPMSTVTTTTTTTTMTTTTTTPTTKKEKLGGFLPNSCHSIFPRFANKKHKDKDKDKEKDKEKEKDSSKSSSHSKEKTLLNTFKKSTAAAANVLSKSQQDDKAQFDKSCLNLNTEMEKLDLNKLESPGNDVLIKLKVASSGAK